MICLTAMNKCPVKVNSAIVPPIRIVQIQRTVALTIVMDRIIGELHIFCNETVSDDLNDHFNISDVHRH